MKKFIKIMIIIIILVTCFLLYSRLIGTKGIITKEYSIINSNIPNSFYGYKIVQLSDIHYKVTTDKSDLDKIVKEINLLKPDIVIFSGDLLDNNIKYENKDYEDLTKFLTSIKANIEKYYISGEEDLKFNNFDSIMSNGNFKNLNNSYELIYNNETTPILLVGSSSNYYEDNINSTINNINSEIMNNTKYKILIIHEPDFIDKIDYSKFNLILAGHSHGGQIKLPFIGGIIKDKYSNNYYKEYYELGNTLVYISSGIGTSKFKFRFLNKPSINLYRLRNK